MRAIHLVPNGIPSAPNDRAEQRNCIMQQPGVTDIFKLCWFRVYCFLLYSIKCVMAANEAGDESLVSFP